MNSYFEKRNNPAKHTEDVPIGAGVNFNKHDLSDRLPKVASLARYELVSFVPQNTESDPVVLRNRWKQIVYQWPDNYIPDWVDVEKVCRELGIC